MAANDPRLRLILSELTIDLIRSFVLLDKQTIVLRNAAQLSTSGPQRFTVRDFARFSDINQRTVRRLLTKLVQDGYIIQHEDGTYTTNMNVDGIQDRIADRINLMRRAANRMAEITGDPAPRICHLTGDQITPAHRLIYAKTLLHLFHYSRGSTAIRYDDLAVSCAIVISTFGPHPLGRNKIAEITRLPTATVSRSLQRQCTLPDVDSGEPRAIRDGDHYFINPAYVEKSVNRYAIILHKLKAMQAFSEELARLEAVPALPDPVA